MKRLPVILSAALLALLLAPVLLASVRDRIYSLRDLSAKAENEGNYQRALTISKEALELLPRLTEADSVDRDDLEAYLRSQIKEYALQTGDNAEALRQNMWLTNNYIKSGDSALITFSYLTSARIAQANNDTAACFANIDTCLRFGRSAAFVPYLPAILNVSGILHRDLGDNDGALSFFEQSLEANRRVNDPDNTFSSLNLMAGCQAMTGDLEHALATCNTMVDTTAALFGTASLQFIKASECAAQVQASTGDTIGGCRRYINVIKALEKNVRESLRILPSANRERSLSYSMLILQESTAFARAARSHADEFTLWTYRGALTTKGLLLASERSTADIINTYGSADDRKEYARLAAIRSRLAEIESDRNASGADVARLYSEAVTIDSTLAARCANYGDVSSFLDIEFRDIADALRPGEAIVDFVNFDRRANGTNYMAYIYSKGDTVPRLEHICLGSSIDSLLALEHGNIVRLHSGESARALSDILLKRLLSLTDASTIYYVPSGILHSIALDALPVDDDNSQLAADRRNFVRLSSARQILKQLDSPVEGRSALYGGLSYDMEPEEMLASANDYRFDDYLAVRGGDSIRGDMPLQHLAFSRIEVDTIASLLASKAPASLYTGPKGTEESFIALDRKSPPIIHIATHGFFFKPDDKNLAIGLKGYTNAMNLSGLVMAGGNAGWLGRELPDGVLNGLLTANDISRLDLSSTSLVCLASCNSGLGEITSEGIYGLQRAFKKAGVQTLVLSLWEASDMATATFMTRFYAGLADGHSRRQAFAMARNYVREKYPDPFYWAGFIMID